MRVITQLIKDVGNTVCTNDQRTQFERVVTALFAKALRGDVRAIQMILERVEGKVLPTELPVPDMSIFLTQVNADIARIYGSEVVEGEFEDVSI